MKLKRIASFGLFLALLLSTLLVFSACKETQTPTSLLDDILEATFGGDSSSLLDNKKSSCMEILFRPTDDLSLDGLGDISLKVYGDKSDNSVFQLRADLFEELLDLDAYTDADTLILASSLLGESAYGISAESLMALLDSYFLPSVDDETMTPATGSASSMITTLLSTLSSEENRQTLSEIVERYVDALKSSLNKDLETSVEYNNKGTTVSFVFNNDSAKKLIKTLFEEMQDDDELREFLRQLLETVSPDITEDLMQEYDSFLSDEAALFELFEELDQEPFSVTVSISADASNVMNAAKLVLDTTDEGEHTRFTLLFDASNENETEFSFKQEVYDDAADTFNTVVGGGICYEVTENTAERYNASLSGFFTQEGAGMDVKVLQVSYNKTNGNYQIRVPLSKLPLNIEQDIVLSGNYRNSDAGTTLTVTQLSAPEIGTIDLDLTIKVTYDVELPKAPAEYRDITLMTEEDLASLMETMMEHPLVQLLLAAAPSDPEPPFAAPAPGGDNDESNSVSGPSDGDVTPDPEQPVYTGTFMGDDATMTVSGDRAIFELRNEETESGITIKQTMRVNGIITEDNGDEITVSFAAQGVSATMQMTITGVGADAVREIVKGQMDSETFNEEEKAILVDLIDGKEVTMTYGTSLWDAMVDMQDNATFTLDTDELTFTEVE